LIDITVQSEFLLRLVVFSLILLVTFIIARVFGILISKTSGKASPTFARQARKFTTWLIWLIGVLVGLGQLGLDLTLLLVIVTLGGVLLLFAFRDILSNWASYETISIYKPFKIGDWVQIGKTFGRVVDITYMDTVLLTPDNETVYVPNRKITQSTVINRTTLGGIRISVPLTVNANLNLSNVEEALISIGNDLSEELVSDSKPEVRVLNMNEQSVRLALLLRINNPAKARLLASQVRKKAKERIDQLGNNI
jgi:small conductance mechanosensitive channel